MSLPCPILYLLSCGQIGLILTYDIPSIRRSLLVLQLQVLLLRIRVLGMKSRFNSKGF